MQPRSFESLRPDLISLGLAYYGKPARCSPDPEKTIIEALKHFSSDPKLYKMVLSWMERFGDLVHVERLASRIDQLTQFEKLILGVTALKLLKSGDHRFKTMFEKIQKQKIELDCKIPGQDEYLIEKSGLDPEFLVFGIRTAKITASANKKLLDRKTILKTNLWLRLRALLGSNYRADIVFVKLSRLAPNAYGAMKFLGCSKETSYRIWGNLQEADVEGLIRVV